MNKKNAYQCKKKFFLDVEYFTRDKVKSVGDVLGKCISPVMPAKIECTWRSSFVYNMVIYTWTLVDNIGGNQYLPY